jgi:hypothetical protein
MSSARQSHHLRRCLQSLTRLLHRWQHHRSQEAYRREVYLRESRKNIGEAKAIHRRVEDPEDRTHITQHFQQRFLRYQSRNWLKKQLRIFRLEK